MLYYCIFDKEKDHRQYDETLIINFPTILQSLDMPFIQFCHLIKLYDCLTYGRTRIQYDMGPSNVAIQTPATIKSSAPTTPSKPEASNSKITTAEDEAAQYEEFLRFKVFQQQFKQQKSHSPTSSQGSSTEFFGTDPIGGQDLHDF
ncbi:hypothetical protein M9H77_00192 [Catharanthus roseus]|nr:hypothetical protein M9H77_00192 [Catharanthus roseus]